MLDRVLQRLQAGSAPQYVDVVKRNRDRLAVRGDSVEELVDRRLEGHAGGPEP
jgi:hypothetical protein